MQKAAVQSTAAISLNYSVTARSKNYSSSPYIATSLFRYAYLAFASDSFLANSLAAFSGF